MSKKDYQAIAAAIYVEWKHADDRADGDGVIAIGRTARALAYVFAKGNPRFDSGRFLEACETGKCKGMRQVA